tara:strand:+ start:834 stop:1355 length:522 start_codon:yes stop_codon:yes gene_type:complete
MKKNFIAVKKQFITKTKCKTLIKALDKGLITDNNKDSNYSFKDIKDKKIQRLIVTEALGMVQKYCSYYPELNLTKDKWAMTSLRFKKFKPGDYFNKWHSEHCGNYATRVMVFQLYLSDHNCGTEFFSGETIQSEAGKAVLFPPYFTHTHRGQPCPQNKIRYLITGYYNFISLT